MSIGNRMMILAIGAALLAACGPGETQRAEDSGTRPDAGRSPGLDGAPAPDARAAADAAVPVDSGPPPVENSGDIQCRHTDCLALDPGDPAYAQGYRFRAEGRQEGPGDQCGAVAESLFTTQQACEDVRFKKLPFVHFYGNRGTWGSLGLDDSGTMWPDVDAVIARFDSLCQQAQSDSGLGEHLRCGADVIGYAPTGYLPVTGQVVDRLITEHDARITIDIRTSTSLAWAEVQAIVENIFSGTSGIIDDTLLDAHPIGLSLDYEPQIVGGGYTAVPASVANAACGAHRSLMTARGHAADDLWCFLYEFGHPTMMGNGDELDPWVFPVLMSGTCGRFGDGSTPESVQDSLDLKETWIDNVTVEYANARDIGCMFFTVPYLTVTQSDQFTFVQALEAFGDKCSVYSFQ